MNFLKENTGAVITLLALVNLSLSMIYNYFYFASFDLSLDMIPATYSDYLISSLDVFAALLIYGLIIAVSIPVFEYCRGLFNIDERIIKKMHPVAESNDSVKDNCVKESREHPLELLFALLKSRTYKLILIIHGAIFIGLSLFLYMDLHFHLVSYDSYTLYVIRSMSLVIFLYFILHPIFIDFYGDKISYSVFAIFLAFTISAFWGSISGHKVRFSNNTPHFVKTSGCNDCAIVKSLSDTYILWDYSANSIVMLNKSEHDVFTIDLRKSTK